MKYRVLHKIDKMLHIVTAEARRGEMDEANRHLYHTDVINVQSCA